jgi:formate hydrogenlyase subunit 3/multisubunit Na+/H+ antiporter MnhD subunit
MKTLLIGLGVLALALSLVAIMGLIGFVSNWIANHCKRWVNIVWWIVLLLGVSYGIGWMFTLPRY